MYLGTTPGTFQQLPFENIMLSNRLTRSGMDLSISTALYLTLLAFNKIGLSVERKSATFHIDISPPDLIRKPIFKKDTQNWSSFIRTDVAVQLRLQTMQNWTGCLRWYGTPDRIKEELKTKRIKEFQNLITNTVLKIQKLLVHFLNSMKSKTCARLEMATHRLLALCSIAWATPK